MKTPDVLIPALRQYRHNQQEIHGYLAGFDYMLTVEAFEKLQADNAKLLAEIESHIRNYVNLMVANSDICKELVAVLEYNEKLKAFSAAVINHCISDRYIISTANNLDIQNIIKDRKC